MIFNKNMNNIDKQTLADYYYSHSNLETAKFLGVSKSQMLRTLKKLGIDKKVPYKKHIPVEDTLQKLMERINKDEFKIDCANLTQKELMAKYAVTCRQLSYLKNKLGLGFRLKYIDDYNINLVKLVKFGNCHTLAETAKEFGISNITTLKNILKRNGLSFDKPAPESLSVAIARIDRTELQTFYANHTFAETSKHFNTNNLRAILLYFGIERKTKQHESFESVLSRIDKNEFSKDYEELPLAELYEKYNIAYTMYRRLASYYGLGYKPGIFAFSDASLSLCEDDLANYIAGLVGKENVLRNDRSALGGQEIDIYIPKKAIGIEFNGNYWHSDQCKPKNYHLEKSKLAAQYGIRLIHIWKYEWQDPATRKKLQQFFNIAFAVNTTRIYARACEVRRISNKEAKAFNEKTHMQGHRNAQVTYGLFYNGELVQLMSFSRTKYNKNLTTDDTWEIIRGCPGSNNIVVGGVSKLFKHFVQDYQPSGVFSYCDFNKFDGKSYEMLGMHFVGYTGPDLKYMLDTGKVVVRSPKNYHYNNSHCKYRLFGAGSKKYYITLRK